MAHDYYQEGYDKGYQDALEGKPGLEYKESPGTLLGGILLDMLNDEDQDEYEAGYEAGHADGKEAREVQEKE